MNMQRRRKFRRLGSLMAVLVVCQSPLSVIAADGDVPATQAFGNSTQVVSNQPLVILPLQKKNSAVGLAFDLGGSETRKLELQLSKPLRVNINNSHQKSSSGVGSVFLDSSMSLRLNDNMDITASLGAGRSQATFQPLGSIHCQNGVLDQGSYRASDCHFINQANVLQQDQVALGLRYGKDNINTAVSMFRHEAGIGQQGVTNYANPIGSSLMGTGLLSSEPGNSLLPVISSGQSLN